ncbi:MAG: carboxypeptidase-like regulatory domain-containing protein [Acidobacteriota bacterium]
MHEIAIGIILSTLFVSAIANAQQPQSEKPAAGDRREVQQPTAAQEKKPQAGGSIKGRVIGEGNRPVADASIMAIPTNIASNPQSMVTSFFRPVSSDADGKFELSGLQWGAYRISASAAGYVLSDSDSKPYYRPGESVTLTLAKGGVITGRVTNLSGDPVVGAVVRAIKVREADNKPVRLRRDLASEFTDSIGSLLGPYKTDDRGIYRIYGLEAGYYQVAAGGRRGQGTGVNYSEALSSPRSGAYDSDAPTYFPSSTIDTAAEVTVRAGDEATNIDIRYRDNRGHSVSGTVSGSKASGQDGISVMLTRAGNGLVEATTYVLPPQKEKGFAFEALLDGEYFVTAMAGSGSMTDGADGLNISVSPSRPVTVSGADVTGVELALEPLASMAGRALIEPISAAQKAECKATRPARLEEVVISARGEGNKKPEDQSLSLLSMLKDTSPNEKGEFTVGFLRPGVHRLDLQLPGDSLYISTVTLPPLTPDGKPIDGTKSGVKLNSGDKVKGLVVTISEGAAGLRGKVVTGKDTNPPSEKMRVYLVPAEPEAGEDVLRYFESELAADGGFSLTSLAPGKYWLVARVVSDQDQAEADHKPLAWDAGGRMSLRFEGEASKKIVELSRCQRVTGFVVSYTPLVRPSKPGRKPTQ